MIKWFSQQSRNQPKPPPAGPKVNPPKPSEVYKDVHEKVLVACPTYQGKSYSLEAYISAYNNFTYPHRHIYMVDNTGFGLRYRDHLRACGIEADHVDPTRDFHETFTASWKKIATKAHEGGFQWVMSIEADNICPPLTIDTMLNVARYCRALHVAHAYPWHKSQSEQGFLTGLGCNLINTQMLWDIFQQKQWYTSAVESELYEYPKMKGFPSVELYNILDVRHLDDEVGAEQYIFPKEDLPAMGKVPDELVPIKYNKAA